MPGGLCVCADCMQKTFDTINNSDINYDDLMNNMPNMGMFGGFNMMGNDISNRQKVKKRKKIITSLQIRKRTIHLIWLIFQHLIR